MEPEHPPAEGVIGRGEECKCGRHCKPFSRALRGEEETTHSREEDMEPTNRIMNQLLVTFPNKN